MQPRTSFLLSFLVCAVFVVSLFLLTSNVSADQCEKNCNLANRDCGRSAQDALAACLDPCDNLTNPDRRNCRRACQAAFNDAKAACREAHEKCLDDCGVPDDSKDCPEVCGAGKTVCLANAQVSLVECRDACETLSNPQRRVCRQACQDTFEAAKEACRSAHQTCIDNCHPDN